jgi:hypothetical protein
MPHPAGHWRYRRRRRVPRPSYFYGGIVDPWHYRTPPVVYVSSPSNNTDAVAGNTTQPLKYIGLGIGVTIGAVVLMNLLSKNKRYQRK